MKASIQDKEKMSVGWTTVPARASILYYRDISSEMKDKFYNLFLYPRRAFRCTCTFILPKQRELYRFCYSESGIGSIQVILKVINS